MDHVLIRKLEHLAGAQRTYGYEWVRLDDDRKRASWLDRKPPPRGGEDLRAAFRAWLAGRPG